VAESDFKYSQPVGFGKFSLVNAAPANSSDPDSPESGLPPRESNPYIGVGSTAQVALRWQDLFGNTTVTPFENPSANYQGALNGSAVTIRYNDRLIGVSSWPNVKASYIYGQSSEAALQINFGLDTARYADDKDQAQRDLALFQRVYFQL